MAVMYNSIPHGLSAIHHCDLLYEIPIDLSFAHFHFFSSFFSDANSFIAINFLLPGLLQAIQLLKFLFPLTGLSNQYLTVFE